MAEKWSRRGATAVSRLLLFGGTTEGRLLAEFCAAAGIPVTVSVATPEGAALLPPGTDVLCGRLDAMQMRALLAAGQYARVVDATHPYAAEVTQNLRTVCGELGIPYSRLLRESAVLCGTLVHDTDELIACLNAHEGTVLSTLGSKALPALTRVRDFRERVWVRVLPTPEIVPKCAALGFSPAHVIAEQPPFSVEQNLAHLRRSGASVLVTKESGSTGGYPGKCEAARRMGVAVITLCRPAEDGLALAAVKKQLEEEWL